MCPVSPVPGLWSWADDSPGQGAAVVSTRPPAHLDIRMEDFHLKIAWFFLPWSLFFVSILEINLFWACPLGAARNKSGSSQWGSSHPFQNFTCLWVQPVEKFYRLHYLGFPEEEVHVKNRVWVGCPIHEATPPATLANSLLLSQAAPPTGSSILGQPELLKHPSQEGHLGETRCPLQSCPQGTPKGSWLRKKAVNPLLLGRRKRDQRENEENLMKFQHLELPMKVDYPPGWWRGMESPCPVYPNRQSRQGWPGYQWVGKPQSSHLLVLELP